MLFAVSAVVVLAGGCATGHVGRFDKPTAEARFGNATEKLWLDADQRARQQHGSAESQNLFAYSYICGYLSGLECAHGTASGGNKNSTEDRGFQAGRAAAIADTRSGTLRATLEDFGYTRISVRGKLKLEFENQEFLPEDSGTRWWVEYNPELEKQYSMLVRESPRRQRDYVFAHLGGYLSPDRRWGVGHFNAYDRNLVVTEIVDMHAYPDGRGERGAGAKQRLGAIHGLGR
jgi:hypothetical protein